MAWGTYRCSSKIKKTGKHLWPRKVLGLLTGHHGLSPLHAVLPPLSTSWQLMKSVEKQVWHHLGLLNRGGENRVPVKLASRHLVSYTKMAAQLDGACNAELWSDKLKRYTCINVAAKAFSKLSKIRRHPDKENHYHERHHKLTRSTTQPCHLKDRAIHSVACKDRQLLAQKQVPMKMKRSVSWGELVHLNEAHHNVILQQFNNRVHIYVVNISL